MDWASIGGSLLQTTGGTLFGNLVNQAFAGRNARMQLKYSKKAMDYTYAKDKEMWDTLNAYNTPAAQMARLQEAGLNPNMMYGTGQGANVSKEMPKYNAPHVSWEAPIVNPFQVLGAYADLKVKNAQADNIQEQTNTRKLENNLRLGTISSAIEKAANEAETAKWRNQLEYIKFLVENQWAGNEDVAPDAQYRPYKKRMGELAITQAAARRTVAEADLKEQEASIYRALKDYFGNSNKAGVWAKLLSQMLLKL